MSSMRLDFTVHIFALPKYANEVFFNKQQDDEILFILPNSFTVIRF